VVMTTRTRLTTDQKLQALAYIARGDTLSQVAGHLLEEHDVTISESALSQLKKNHKSTIDKMIDTMAEGQATEADAILRRTRRLLNGKLDRAERDARTIEELDQQWRDGELKDVAVYRRRKAGLIKVSVAELTQISKTMFDQTIKEPGAPAGGAGALPPGQSVKTPAQLEGLLQAIAAGNTVEIQRLIFTPGATPHDLPV
jgi:hypothetical protein